MNVLLRSVGSNWLPSVNSAWKSRCRTLPTLAGMTTPFRCARPQERRERARELVVVEPDDALRHPGGDRAGLTSRSRAIATDVAAGDRLSIGPDRLAAGRVVVADRGRAAAGQKTDQGPRFSAPSRLAANSLGSLIDVLLGARLRGGFGPDGALAIKVDLFINVPGSGRQRNSSRRRKPPPPSHQPDQVHHRVRSLLRTGS